MAQLTDQPTKTLKERINEDGITSDLVRIDARPRFDPQWDCYGYLVTLRMGRRIMRVKFWTGKGWTEAPDTTDVMENLLADSSGYINAPTLTDWIEEYGYGGDDDVKRARATFMAVKRQHVKLERFLGDKLDDYLWRTEG